MDEPIVTWELTAPDGTVEETYTATAADMAMHWDGQGGYGFRVVNAATHATVMVCTDYWSSDFVCDTCRVIRDVDALASDSFAVHDAPTCHLCCEHMDDDPAPMPTIVCPIDGAQLVCGRYESDPALLILECDHVHRAQHATE